jgi:hypothetical protein
MEAAGSFEKLASIYQAILRHISEDITLSVIA